jgi:hypothetical protein
MFIGGSVVIVDNLPLPQQPLSYPFNLSEDDRQSFDRLLILKRKICLMPLSKLSNVVWIIIILW